MRSAQKKSTEASVAAVQPARQPEDLQEQQPLRELQQAAGNQAMLRLLGAGTVQRKAKGSESGEAKSDQTPAPAPAMASLIVDDEAPEVGPGQMRKSEFLSQLRTEVCSTAEEALQGTMWSAMGCPYIDKWLNHYAAQPSSHLERALRKYAPETASARSAQDYIPLVTRRVRRGIEEWSSTGEVKDLPEEFAEGGMPGATVSGLMGALMSGVGSAISGLVSGAGKALSSVGSMLFKHREGAEAESDADPEAIRAQLGSGQALDSSVRRRMQSAFGHDFAGVRVHHDAKARELSEGMNARAFTVGNDIAFGGEEYKPGTPVGDALIAHELAHVVQQGGSANGGAQHKGGAAYGSLEEDADRSAVGAVAKLWMGARGELSQIGQNAMPRLRSGLRLQGCSSPKPNQKQDDVDLSAFWTVESLVKVFTSKGDDEVIKAINDNGYTIISFETAYDTWRYPDGREVEIEIEGLQGNTKRDTKEIRLREALTTQQAATALHHEVGHVIRPADQNYLEQEIEVRIATEEFLIKHGWPPFDPTYRNGDGSVNKEAIRADIMGSSHYNPIDRRRIRRRYEGEKTTTGWKLP